MGLMLVNQYKTDTKYFPKNFLEVYKANVFFGMAYQSIQSDLKLHAHFLAEHQERASKGHFGTALSYLRKSKQTLTILNQRKEILDKLTGQQKTQLQSLQKEVDSLLSQAE